MTFSYSPVPPSETNHFFPYLAEEQMEVENHHYCLLFSFWEIFKEVKLKKSLIPIFLLKYDRYQPRFRELGIFKWMPRLHQMSINFKDAYTKMKKKV